MKYLKRYNENIRHNIDDDIDDIFADLSDLDLRVVRQIQDRFIVVYICGQPLTDVNFYMKDIKNEVSHFISKMEEDEHTLISVRYRFRKDPHIYKSSAGNTTWKTLYPLWNGVKPIFTTPLNLDTSDLMDSFELKFTK